MITLHYLEDSRAQRILWMLEEVGAPYEVEVYRRDPETSMAPRELRALHPLGKSPVIEDDGAVIAESGAIIEHIAEAHAPELYPTEPEARRGCRYWLHYAEGSLAPLLVMQVVFTKAREKVPRLLRPVLFTVPSLITKVYLAPNLARHLKFVEAHLKDREFFVGESLTVADIQMSFGLEAIATRRPGEYPHIEAFVKRLQARPAYQRALDAVPLTYQYLAR